MYSNKTPLTFFICPCDLFHFNSLFSSYLTPDLSLHTDLRSLKISYYNLDHANSSAFFLGLVFTGFAYRGKILNTL